ncbi:TspO/MBR family protein [Loigolactobacillus rennini]|uniref:Tryptophan-rich sensory protein n=2 Tax=Loigolactobacillus rennini TaxID=238013 RepID=A0A0R2CZ31_9LACO|nr:TspO/MBR family protein [Loigolactobacillus rennini]KRM93030.1 tryptophan-rich sensory protein [Loigolactobacillus rennini DSM 20253]SFZ88310.1 Tryptophan-rich sensory protein [Loigolactobacillus rennini]
MSKSPHAPRAFNWKHLLAIIIVVEALGMLSALLAGNIRVTYLHFALPQFSPPASLFGIVWPLLYLMIAIAGYLYFKANGKTWGYTLFGSQLLLNFIWSIIFFHFNWYWLGLIIIIVLDLAVIACIREFSKNSRWSAWLLVPYLIWLLFATYLTVGVALLN